LTSTIYCGLINSKIQNLDFLTYYNWRMEKL
jgi:hypothetical protein